MKSEHDRLIEARTLIQVKHYDEARAILRTMPNNETARRWLAKLDGGTPKQQRRAALVLITLLMIVVTGALLVVLVRDNQAAVPMPSATILVVAAAPTNTPLPVSTITNTSVPSATNSETPTSMPTNTETPADTSTFTATLLPTSTTTPSATFTSLPPPPPNTVIGSNDVRFTVEGIEVHGNIGSVVPQNGVFLTVLGSLYNFTGTSYCADIRDFLLSVGDQPYYPQDAAMRSIQGQFQPHRSIPSEPSACVSPGQRLPILVAFDVPPYNGGNSTITFASNSAPLPYSWFDQGVSVVAAMTASAPTRTPVPTSTRDPGDGTRSDPYLASVLYPVQDGIFYAANVYVHADNLMQQLNMFNADPGAGQMWVVAAVAFQCTLDTDQTCDLDLMDFELVGREGHIYERAFAVGNDQFGGEVFGGSAATAGWVAFLTDANDSDFELILNQYGERTFFRLTPSTLPSNGGLGS